MTQLLYLLGSVCCSDSSTKALIEVELHALPEQLRGSPHDFMFACSACADVTASQLHQSGVLQQTTRS
jgi:hypothetical protein